MKNNQETTIRPYSVPVDYFKPITDFDTASAYLSALVGERMEYHLEDHAYHVFPNLPGEITETMNKRADEMYDLAKGTFGTGCPIALMMELIEGRDG